MCGFRDEEHAWPIELDDAPANAGGIRTSSRFRTPRHVHRSGARAAPRPSHRCTPRSSRRRQTPRHHPPRHHGFVTTMCAHAVVSTTPPSSRTSTRSTGSSLTVRRPSIGGPPRVRARSPPVANSGGPLPAISRGRESSGQIVVADDDDEVVRSVDRATPGLIRLDRHGAGGGGRAVGHDAAECLLGRCRCGSPRLGIGSDDGQLSKQVDQLFGRADEVTAGEFLVADHLGEAFAGHPCVGDRRESRVGRPMFTEADGALVRPEILADGHQTARAAADLVGGEPRRRGRVRAAVFVDEHRHQCGEVGRAEAVEQPRPHDLGHQAGRTRGTSSPASRPPR